MSNEKDCGLLGRNDGQKQKGSSENFMRFRFEFPSQAHWQAYITGFYRGCGYSGSGNRTIRKSRG